MYISYNIYRYCYNEWILDDTYSIDYKPTFEFSYYYVLDIDFLKIMKLPTSYNIILL